MTSRLVACALIVLACRESARADGGYASTRRDAAGRRAVLAERWDRHGPGRELSEAIAGEIVASVSALARGWLGTAWGLGTPQAMEPGPGKINCGTFVGTVLRDAGFIVDVAKLQRQPSQLIIRSFVGRKRMKKWSRASIERFVADVRAMGPGLFIIGLDFHVGLLIQTDEDLRFIHASYVTRTVVDEPAATAVPIVDSKYRVVGKLVDERNVRDWIEGRRIRVRGTW